MTFQMSAPSWSLTCRVSYSQVSRYTIIIRPLLAFPPLLPENKHTSNLCFARASSTMPFSSWESFVALVPWSIYKFICQTVLLLMPRGLELFDYGDNFWQWSLRIDRSILCNWGRKMIQHSFGSLTVWQETLPSQANMFDINIEIIIVC